MENLICTTKGANVPFSHETPIRQAVIIGALALSEKTGLESIGRWAFGWMHPIKYYFNIDNLTPSQAKEYETAALASMNRIEDKTQVTFIEARSIEEAHVVYSATTPETDPHKHMTVNTIAYAFLPQVSGDGYKGYYEAGTIIGDIIFNIMYIGKLKMLVTIDHELGHAIFGFLHYMIEDDIETNMRPYHNNNLDGFTDWDWTQIFKFVLRRAINLRKYVRRIPGKQFDYPV